MPPARSFAAACCDIITSSANSNYFSDDERWRRARHGAQGLKLYAGLCASIAIDIGGDTIARHRQQ